MMETLEIIPDDQLTLTKQEQRLLGTHNTIMTFDHALSVYTALVRRITTERRMFENPTGPQVTGWFRRPTLRRMERQLAAADRFAERIPIAGSDWDDMDVCYEINLNDEGL